VDLLAAVMVVAVALRLPLLLAVVVVLVDFKLLIPGETVAIVQ
jgi:hypothetical protein